jgi:hypothetical protein
VSREEARVAWRRVSRGLLYLGFGILLLLTTLDYLSWWFWCEALTFWPVLLVGLGIRLIFERSPAPWLILLSPLLILGTLTYVAQADVVDAPFGWESVSASRPEGVDRWSLHGLLVLARVEMKSGPLSEDLLVDGRSSSGWRRGLRVSERGDSARVRLGGRHWDGWSIRFLPDHRERWDLELAEDLPLSLALDSAFVSGEVDLETATLTRAELEGAFNDLVLTLAKPESDVRLRFEGAFNQIELVVPPSTPVSVSTDGFLNVVDGRSNAPRLGDPGYRVRVDGAFNRVVVSSL